MNRIFVGSFLSGLVLLLAYQGVSAQRNVSVATSESATVSKACCLEATAADPVSACCQDSAEFATRSEPKPFVIEPVFASAESVEFTAEVVANDTTDSEPIFQVSAVEAGPASKSQSDFGFSPAPSRSAEKPSSQLQPIPESNQFPADFEGSEVIEEEVPPAMDRIWIMIHPDQGLQFLQTAEEVLLKKGQGAGTQQFFLIDCDTFSMEGKLGEGKPDFLLTCESVFLQGAFQTDKALEIKSAKLSYDTATRVLTLSGTEDAPVEVSVQDKDEMKLQAQEILLRLKEGSYQLQVSGADVELNTTPPLRLAPVDRNVFEGNNPF